jgi:hypothetical protein
MADSHDGRDARVLPGIGSLPIKDQQPSITVVARKIGKKTRITGLAL